MRAGDINARYGLSTMQRASAVFELFGFPAGSLTEADVEELGPQPQPGRVVDGRFTTREAAFGLVIATILMLYLGSRVVVVK